MRNNRRTHQFGPLELSLARVAYAKVDGLRGEPIGDVFGAPARWANIAGYQAFVFDHRSDTSVVARIEVWTPNQPVEGGLRCIVVLADARPDRVPGSRTLEELLATLDAAPIVA